MVEEGAAAVTGSECPCRSGWLAVGPMFDTLQRSLLRGRSSTGILCRATCKHRKTALWLHAVPSFLKELPKPKEHCSRPFSEFEIDPIPEGCVCDPATDVFHFVSNRIREMQFN